MSEAPHQTFLQSAREHLAAGFPLLFWVTHEERRALGWAKRLLSQVPVHVWSATRCLDSESGATRLADALFAVRAQPGPALCVLLDAHRELEDPVAVRALRDFAAHAETGQKAAILIGPVLKLPVELEKDAAVMDVPLPSQAELEALLQAELARRGSEVDVSAMARAASGLTWLEAQRAFALALSRRQRNPIDEVIAQKRGSLRRSAALELVDADTSLDDVGGLDVLKAWLGTRLAAFRPEARQFGLPEPRGMMVCGIQGCGKSLVAKAAARVFAVPLVRLDFAAVFAASSPELTVRQATRIAEAVAPVVLWIDEIEKGLGGDSAGQARVFGDFLVWMQERRGGVFVAATANEVDRLPPELVRRGRFDEVFFVDLPGAQERAEILSIHLQRRERDPSRFPVEQLTRDLDHYSGAELEQIVIAGLFRAYAAGRDLTADDLRLSAKELVPLATMYEERVQALRTWAHARARRASPDRRTLELFDE